MPKSKKKYTVLQVLPRLETGGVERGTIETVKGLHAGGHKALVVSAGGKWSQQVDYAGGIHITLPVDSKNPLTIWKNSFRLEKIIQEHKVDIVHARSRAPAWSAYLATKRTDCHFMTTFHGVYSLNNNFPLKRRYNEVMLKGERVIVISEYIRNHIMSVYGEQWAKKLRLVHRGVDLEAFDRSAVTEPRVVQLSERLGIEHDRTIILLPGRLSEWKGHTFLLEALKDIDRKKFLCLFAGNHRPNSQYRRDLDQLVLDYELQDNVRMIGGVDDMPALYSLADIVVSAATSRAEAFGRVSVESQAMERLTIATDHGGSSETMIDKKTGWLVEPGNVEQLTKALEAALSCADKKRKKIASDARKHVEKNFSMNKMVQETLDVYKELLS